MISNKSKSYRTSYAKRRRNTDSDYAELRKKINDDILNTDLYRNGTRIDKRIVRDSIIAKYTVEEYNGLNTIRYAGEKVYMTYLVDYTDYLERYVYYSLNGSFMLSISKQSYDKLVACNLMQNGVMSVIDAFSELRAYCKDIRLIFDRVDDRVKVKYDIQICRASCIDNNVPLDSRVEQLDKYVHEVIDRVSIEEITERITDIIRQVLIIVNRRG